MNGAQQLADPAAAAMRRVTDSIDELGLSKHVVELETQGFTTVKGAIDADQVDGAKQAILARAKQLKGREIDEHAATAADVEGVTYIPYMLYEDEIFEDILMAPKPLALVTYLLGESCLLSSMGCHFRGPGGAPLPLHSDNGNGIPAPFSATSQVANVNYALTPYSRPAGALAMVPGSHKLARQPKLDEMGLGEGGNPDAVSMDIEPGDAVVWHGNTWHGSFVRELPGVRMNLAVYFNRIYIQTQERHGDAVPEAVRERHANDQRFLNLLGAKQAYGWRKEGPDYSKFALMPRGLYD